MLRSLSALAGKTGGAIRFFLNFCLPAGRQGSFGSRQKNIKKSYSTPYNFITFGPLCGILKVTFEEYDKKEYSFFTSESVNNIRRLGTVSVNKS